MKKNIFHFLDILSNNFYKYLYKLYNLYKYKNILEYVPNLDTKIKNQTYSINSPDTSILIDITYIYILAYNILIEVDK